jgi:t-SNARE complex subunit (syntaxin)
LKAISKLSNNVVELENQANEAAKKMEEAFTKAQIARNKMIQVFKI